jgi:membrane-associated protease RseP (regulator of RpoE activity)
MRRFQALLIAAGLATAPSSAVAGPSHDPWSSDHGVERFEWSTNKGRLGMTVMPLTPVLRRLLGTPDDRGVLVAHVEPGTPAAVAGITVGDVIVEVRGTSIDAASDVQSALAGASKGQTVTIQLVRSGKPRSLQATLTDHAPSVFDRTWPGMRWWQQLVKPNETDLRS